MLSFVGEKEDEKSYWEKWDKYKLLSDNEKDLIASNELAENIRSICTKNHFGQNEASAISTIVRLILFKEISINNLASNLTKLLNLQAEIVNTLSEEIVNGLKDARSQLENQKYTEKEEKGDEKEKFTLISIRLLEGLKNLPELSDQVITSEKIILRNFPDPVRPSLKNWLNDYFSTLGNRRHDSVERGNYLFQSANARKLSSADRQKLAFVLKAYDENTPVSINKDSKQIIFQIISKPAKEERGAMINNQQTENRIPGRISFSSPQKLPYERMKNNLEKPLTPQSTPLPKNVVNLRKTE